MHGWIYIYKRTSDVKNESDRARLLAGVHRGQAVAQTRVTGGVGAESGGGELNTRSVLDKAAAGLAEGLNLESEGNNNKKKALVGLG